MSYVVKMMIPLKQNICVGGGKELRQIRYGKVAMSKLAGQIEQGSNHMTNQLHSASLYNVCNL